MSTTFPPQGRKPKARPKKVVGGRARCKKIALRARHVAAPASSSASSSKSAHVLRAWAPRARVLGLQTSERLGWRPATPASSCHSQRRTPLDPRQRIGHTSQSRAPAPNLGCSTCLGRSHVLHKVIAGRAWALDTRSRLHLFERVGDDANTARETEQTLRRCRR